MAEKRCTGCGEIKPFEAFGVSRKMKDGRTCRCRDCTSVAKALWRKRNAAKIKAERSRQTAAQKARERQVYPEKVRARKAVEKAVARGKIVKPDRCEDCGQAVDRRLLHGHHHDYSKPLEVEWICATCHSVRHLAERVAA